MQRGTFLNFNPIVWFRKTSFHKAVTQHPFVRVPANFWEKAKRDIWSENQRSLAIDEAARLTKLDPGTPLTLHYDLSVESDNLGEIVACLLLAKYLARSKFPVNFVLSMAEFSGSSEDSEYVTFNKRQSELQSIAKQMSKDEFVLTICESRPAGDRPSNPLGHVLFEELYRSRTPIIQATLSLFSIPKFIEKFGDPKNLVDWDPSGYIGWNVRSSSLNSARNYWSDKLLVEDAQTLAGNFPELEIRVFTDENGRQKFREVASRQAVLETMLTQGKISFQRAEDFSGAATEVAGCNFWFQRLGGGVNLFPLFSEMPFLMLSEDYRIRNLAASQGWRLYSWHKNTQTWLLSLDAPFKKLSARFLASQDSR